MNIPGRIAGAVLVVIGLGWLVSLFSGTLFNNRTANNINPSTQSLGTTTKQSPLAASGFNTQKLTTGTVQQNNQTAQQTTQQTATTANTTSPQTTTTPQPSPTTAAADKTQEFEQSPRAATPAPTPTPTPQATIAPTEPVRAGW